MFLVPSYSCLCPIHWSQALSWKAMLQLHLSDQELCCLLRCHLYYSFHGTLFTVLYVAVLCVIRKLLHLNSIHTALFVEKFHNISNVFKSAILHCTRASAVMVLPLSWFWLCRIKVCFSSIRKDFNNVRRVSVDSGLSGGLLGTWRIQFNSQFSSIQFEFFYCFDHKGSQCNNKKAENISYNTSKLRLPTQMHMDRLSSLGWYMSECMLLYMSCSCLCHEKPAIFQHSKCHDISQWPFWMVSSGQKSFTDSQGNFLETVCNSCHVVVKILIINIRRSHDFLISIMGITLHV